MTSGIGADDSLPANLYKVKSRFSDEENVVFCPVAKQSPGSRSFGAKNNDPLEVFVFIGLFERLSWLG
jgi:hypothetical protein